MPYVRICMNVGKSLNFQIMVTGDTGECAYGIPHITEEEVADKFRKYPYKIWCSIIIII